MSCPYTLFVPPADFFLLSGHTHPPKRSVYLGQVRRPTKSKKYILMDFVPDVIENQLPEDPRFNNACSNDPKVESLNMKGVGGRWNWTRIPGSGRGSYNPSSIFGLGCLSLECDTGLPSNLRRPDT